MTKQEYEDFKRKEEELNKQSDRMYKFEKLRDKAEKLKKEISKINKMNNFGSLETTGDYTSVYITDIDFCRKKLLEIYIREKELVEEKIASL